jgi:hypothetical protein
VTWLARGPRRDVRIIVAARAPPITAIDAA